MISKIIEIIQDAKAGKPFILMDDEGRENEGDVIIPAEFATPEVINFMITHAKGLVCLALQKQRINELDLSLMSTNNQSRFETAFTTSIEAKNGITTGISAFDRSHTILTAINSTKEDLVTPGHIFPLMAKDGGVLVRAGHTEASVDISILAGLKPSAVICEIINEDGTMARMDDIVEFAKKHNLKIGLIKDLIEYRVQKENIVQKISEKQDDKFSNRKIITYMDTVANAIHYVIQFGNINTEKSVNTKFHVMDYINDIHSSDNIRKTMEYLEQHTGVLVLIENKAHNKGKESGVIRQHGIGVSIIKNLGINKITILSKTKQNPVAISGFGVEISGFKNIE